MLLIVKIFLLVLGVSLIGYAQARPEVNLFASTIGGMCLGAFVVLSEK